MQRTIGEFIGACIGAVIVVGIVTRIIRFCCSNSRPRATKTFLIGLVVFGALALTLGSEGAYLFAVEVVALLIWLSIDFGLDSKNSLGPDPDRKL